MERLRCKKISAKRIVIALVGFFVLSWILTAGVLIWGSWITPFEKSALRTALNSSEAIETCSTDIGPQFDALGLDADKAMGIAEHRAITEYDHRLVMIAQMQLKGAKAICTLRWKAMTDANYARPLQVVQGAQADGYKMLRSHL